MPLDPASTLVGAGPLGAFSLILLYQLRDAQKDLIEGNKEAQAELAEVNKATADANKQLAEALAGFRGWLEGRLD